METWLMMWSPSPPVRGTADGPDMKTQADIKPSEWQKGETEWKEEAEW